jgi:CheY-like chemotaxis protein
MTEARTGRVPALPPIPGCRAVILLIEDDLVTLHITTALLTRMRLPYLKAQTGAEALEHLWTSPIDLIIADLRLPDMSGLDLLDQAFAKRHLKDIPVIFCTAASDQETVERALRLGAVDFVKKPASTDNMAARIDRALARVPQRWEPARDVMKRSGLDVRAYYSLLASLRAGIVDLLGLLDAEGTADEAVTAAAETVRSGAGQAGAIRTSQVLDVAWLGPDAPRDRAMMAEALALELKAFDVVLQSRNARPYLPATATA